MLGVGLPPTIQVFQCSYHPKRMGAWEIPNATTYAENFHPKCGVFTVGPFFQRLCCQLGWGRHSLEGISLGVKS